MPTLVLLRHSRTEPHRLDDRTRELTERGRADAAAVRQWLADRDLHPDRAVVSTSTRTQQTWEIAGDLEPVLDERVYDASTGDLRDVIAETPEGVQCLVVVGHNPGINELAWQLERSVGEMRTSAVAVFDVTDWDLSEAVLRELAAPRGG